MCCLCYAGGMAVVGSVLFLGNIYVLCVVRGKIIRCYYAQGNCENLRLGIWCSFEDMRSCFFSNILFYVQHLRELEELVIRKMAFGICHLGMWDLTAFFDVRLCRMLYVVERAVDFYVGRL